jgi:hypothetical protein
MRAQKMREEAAKKERDEYFNIIWSVILMKQEWRVKEKVNTPAPTTSDDNMVFMLSVEFRGVEEEVAQMCLGPKEAMFEKPEESSQHLKPLYIWGHINGKPVSEMFVDGGAAIKLMSYSVFKKLGREDDELVKTNLTLNSVGATRWRPEVSSPWSSS